MMAPTSTPMHANPAMAAWCALCSRPGDVNLDLRMHLQHDVCETVVEAFIKSTVFGSSRGWMAVGSIPTSTSALGEEASLTANVCHGSTLKSIAEMYEG